MVVLMDPMEDPDDILRANRSREKQFIFDHTFDFNAKQVIYFDIHQQYALSRIRIVYIYCLKQ
jgi:hypothetical protein